MCVHSLWLGEGRAHCHEGIMPSASSQDWKKLVDEWRPRSFQEFLVFLVGMAFLSMLLPILFCFDIFDFEMRKLRIDGD
jgi:hypothetical protein